MKIFGKTLGWKFLGLLLNPTKAHEESINWALELTQGSRALNGQHVPEDLKEPSDRTIFTASGKLFSGMVLIEDYFTMTKTIFYPLTAFLATLVINCILMTGTLFKGVHDFSSISNFGNNNLFLFIFLLLGGVVFGWYFIMEIVYAIATNGSGFNWRTILKNGVLLGGIACSYHFGVSDTHLKFVEMIVGFISPVFYMYLCNEKINIDRARDLAQQELNHGHTLGFTHTAFYTDSEKILQVEAAIKDPTKLIRLGTASGRARANGKSNAPVAGAPVVISEKDIQESHVQILGNSGFGKTTMLRSIIEQLYNTDCGMLVVDGKQVLCSELGIRNAENPHGLLDAIISPDRTKNFAILEGLSPEERAEQILSVTGSTNAKKDIWDSAGGLNLYYAGAIQDLIVSMSDPKNVKPEVLQHFANATDKPWSGFSEIYGYDESFMTYKNIGVQILETPDPNAEEKHQIIQILECHARSGEVDSKGKPTAKAMYIKQCVDYIKNKGNAGKDRINSSVEFTVDTWNSLLTQAEDLLGWAMSIKSDVLLSSILQGKKIGIEVNKKYEKAGILIVRFAIARVMKEIGKRDAKWWKDPTQKRVYFICDEAQDILTEYMVSNAATFRSQGMHYFSSTQTEAGLTQKLGKELKEAYKTHFAHKIWFYVEDKESVESMIDLCGKTDLIRSSNKSNQAIDFDKTADNIAGSAEFDITHPDAHSMRKTGSNSLIGKFKRNISTRTKDAFKAAKGQGDGDQIVATYFKVGENAVPVMTHKEIELLSNKGYCIARIKRAGYFRVDVIKARGVDEKGNVFE
ncbi:TraM recognition domain-containing protein [Aquitalea pelogenes]|uniref:TraM recognition domain-containing protein n=1 Tax=Aquitalea pelogenes TaxID=1293573 RepID=UPI0035AFA469